jgi:hypothetical protein
MRHVRALLAALLLALPAAAHANDLDQDIELSGLAGLYSSSSKISGNAADKVGKPGPLLGFRYVYNLDTWLGAGFQVDVAKPGAHDSTKLLTNNISTTKLLTGEALVLGRVRFLQNQFRPYVMLGLGVHSTSLRLDSKPAPGFFWNDTGTTETRTLVNSRKMGIAVAFEGGFDYHFTNTVSAGTFLAIHSAGKASYAATAAGTAAGLTGVKGSFLGMVLGASLTGRF